MQGVWDHPTCVRKRRSYTKRDKDYWTVGAWYFEVQKMLQRRYYRTTLTSYANHFTCCILTPTSFIHSYPIYKRFHLFTIMYVCMCVCVFIGMCVSVHVHVTDDVCVCVHRAGATGPDQYL